MAYSKTPTHIRAFYQPETYPHPAKHIEMIQTHASWVFLSGDYAYKFKKPVNFGFMDFSTLAKRKYYCEQELKLNRRLAPALYLDVLPIYRNGDIYNLSGPGDIVDYCLKMVRFRQSDLFDQKLLQDEFDPQWMDQLAKYVAGFHDQADINIDTGFDHTSLLASHIQDNLDIASEHTGFAIEPKTLQSLSVFINTELAAKQNVLKQRQTELHIRHCHGDLHFRNITLVDDKPVLFDCIEFNDAYRIIDTMNDVAFLVMDCDAHMHPDLGMRFLSRYLEYSGDYTGLALLPLYLIYRASVRGKVACILADELPTEQQQPQWHEVQKYFALATIYAKPAKPALFAIGGLSGSGKSHLALLGCGPQRAVIIRSDATRKRIAPDYPDLEQYGRNMHIHTYNGMFDAARTALKAGFSVILDATFLHPDSRNQVSELASACNVLLHFYWLDIDPETLKNNIIRRQQTGHDISDADLDVLNRQLTGYRRPEESGIRFLTSSETFPFSTTGPD
ncbi:MAG: AAA family ATPase [Mariprofundus sp.]|nr:AAA family ATPase [Mariprofundus sp.]